MTGATRLKVALVEPRRRALTEISLVVMMGICLLLTSQIPTVDPHTLDGFGVITALPALAWMCLAGAVTVFVAALFAPVRDAVRGLAATGMAVVFYTLPSVIYAVPKTATAWIHWGLVDQLARYGETIPSYDIRFSWPGFFSGTALLSASFPASAPFAVLAWAPAMLGVLSGLSVYFVAHRLYPHSRVAWMASGLFVALDSIGQNYFSPQGFSLSLVFFALALVLPSAEEIRTRTRPQLSARHYALFSILVITLAPTHQISPFFLLILLAPLMLLFPRVYVPLAGVTIVSVLTWWVLGATEFWTNHSSMVTNQFTKPQSALSVALLDRITGDPNRQLMVWAHSAIALIPTALVALVFLSLWRRWTRVDVVFLYWTIAPFGIVLAQTYGGEVLLRSYLFALPLAATYLARALTHSAVFARRTKTARASFLIRALATTLCIFLAATSSIAFRGQDDAFNSFAPSDKRVADLALELPGQPASVAALNGSSPARYRNLKLTKQVPLAVPCAIPDITTLCIQETRPVRIYSSLSQENEGVYLYGRPRGWTQAIKRSLVQSGRYRVLWEEDEAWILELIA